MSDDRVPRPTYAIEDSPHLQEELALAGDLRVRLDTDRSLPEKTGLWSAIQERLRAKWTYHSNAIEGSSLTLGERSSFSARA